MLRFYYEFFSCNQGFRKACWALVALVIIYFIVCILTIVLACLPTIKTWDSSPSGACTDGCARMMINAAFNLAIDMIIVALPMRSIWQLQLSKRKRVQVCLAFGAGML